MIAAGGARLGHDHLGSPTVKLDGAQATTASFDPWGRYETGEPAQDGLQIGFTGHGFDPESGLVYAQARYYEPGLGRFLSRDAYPGDLESPASLERFGYAGGNPHEYVDPDGRLFFLAALIPAIKAIGWTAVAMWGVNTAVDVAVDYGAHRAFGEGEFGLWRSIAINGGVNAATGGLGGKLKHLQALRNVGTALGLSGRTATAVGYGAFHTVRSAADAVLTTGVEGGVAGFRGENYDALGGFGWNLAGGLLGGAAGDLAGVGVKKLGLIGYPWVTTDGYPMRPGNP